MNEHQKLFWQAVASWLRKEAGEAVRHDRDPDLFAGLARSIEYGLETVTLAEAKDTMFKRGPNAA